MRNSELLCWCPQLARLPGFTDATWSFSFHQTSFSVPVTARLCISYHRSKGTSQRMLKLRCFTSWMQKPPFGWGANFSQQVTGNMLLCRIRANIFLGKEIQTNESKSWVYWSDLFYVWKTKTFWGWRPIKTVKLEGWCKYDQPLGGLGNVTQPCLSSQGAAVRGKTFHFIGFTKEHSGCYFHLWHDLKTWNCIRNCIVHNDNS